MPYSRRGTYGLMTCLWTGAEASPWHPKENRQDSSPWQPLQSSNEALELPFTFPVLPPGLPWLSLVLLSILAFPGSPWPSLTLPRPPLLWALGNFEKAFQKLIASTSFCFPAVPGFPADLSGMCIPKSLDIPALPLKTLGTTVELNASGCKMPQCSFHYNLRMMSLCFPESPLPHLLGPHRSC